MVIALIKIVDLFFVPGCFVTFLPELVGIILT